MTTYARVQSGVVAEIFTPPNGFTLAESLVPMLAAECVALTGITPAPQQGWTATEVNGVRSFSAPPAPPSPPGPTIQAQAMAALTVMDAPGGCAIRCFKAGVPFPANWQAYTAALRAIVNGTASPMPTAIPVAPPFPPGT